MQLSKLLLISPIVVGSAQFTEIINGVESIVSDITSVGGDASSVLPSVSQPFRRV
jgi:hypothetical protein